METLEIRCVSVSVSDWFLPLPKGQEPPPSPNWSASFKAFQRNPRKPHLPSDTLLSLRQEGTKETLLIGSSWANTGVLLYSLSNSPDGIPWWLGKESDAMQEPQEAGASGDVGLDPWVRKIPWRREWQPTPVFLPGEFHGQKSLEGYSPWGHKELDMTKPT